MRTIMRYSCSIDKRRNIILRRWQYVNKKHWRPKSFNRYGVCSIC
jgi:hypothetical protein